MNANELMLGNYVKETATNRIGTILYVDFDKAKVKLEHSTIFCPIQAIELIPLTEKLLLDFGFTQTNSAFDLVINEFKISMFFHDSWHFIFETKAEKAQLIGYWSVHELQNLYHILSGRFLQLVEQTNG